MSANCACALDDIAILLPAWQPEAMLVPLALKLRAAGYGVVLIVDDGTSPEARAIFTELQQSSFPVLRHARNRGKGRALKTGFNAILGSYPQIRGVVTADADGQHTPADILHVAQTLAATIASRKPHCVLGVREFEGDVPLRSRFGNALSRFLFNLAAGTRLTDTQTGLRGFPVTLLPKLIEIRGERYEYEMAVLAHLCHCEARPIELPIETVYNEANRSSHFHPLRDSLQIYFVLARFFLGSVARRLRFRLRPITAQRSPSPSAAGSTPGYSSPTESPASTRWPCAPR